MDRGGAPITAASPDEEDAAVPAADAVVLPEPIRLRVVALAADRLGALPPDEVPSALRAHARFTPGRRARLAAGPIAAALESGPAFRDRVAAGVRELMPELAVAVDEGSVPPAAAPEDVGALAYLLRPSGWQLVVEEAARALSTAAATAAAAGGAATVARLQEQLTAVRRAGRAEAELLRTELAVARAEGDELRRRLRDGAERVRRAERAVAAERDAAAAQRKGATTAGAAVEAETRRLRARLADAEAALEAARRSSREGRSADEVRLRLLLDTVVDAASGLRRELALPAVTVRPADLVAGDGLLSGGARGTEPARGLAADDPLRLDSLLAIPHTHLLVDGYNVTKLGYGGLPLETQRGRLVRALAALAAQTGVELTCVFDGAERPTQLAVPVPRNIRVLFSAAAETADELIARLVRAEPAGRPLVVVSSDREVADGVREAGARAVPSAALLRRLDRG
ncbi:MAG: NYN domain-containing protein [Mycobacteriales bacterium]